MRITGTCYLLFVFARLFFILVLLLFFLLFLVESSCDCFSYYYYYCYVYWCYFFCLMSRRILQLSCVALSIACATGESARTLVMYKSFWWSVRPTGRIAPLSSSPRLMLSASCKNLTWRTCNTILYCYMDAWSNFLCCESDKFAASSDEVVLSVELTYICVNAARKAR